MAGPLAVVISAVLWLVWAAPARAQTELQSLLDPRFGHQMGRADYRLTLYPSEPVSGQMTDLKLLQHNGTFFFPLLQTSRDEWALTGRLRYQKIETDAVLPDTGVPFPDALWDILVGVTYRHRFENNWIAGGGLSVGSASDQPFDSTEELTGRAFVFLRIPHQERHAWLLSLFYVPENRELGGYPIPGLAYLYTPSETFSAVIGVPFSAVEYKPVEQIILEAQYFPVRRVRARATYRPFRPLRAYLGFDWDNDGFFLADREDKHDRLSYYEKRLTVGTRFDLRHFGVDVAGGWAFDRFYFEGEDYGDRRQNRIDIEDGPFIAVRASVRF